MPSRTYGLTYGLTYNALAQSISPFTINPYNSIQYPDASWQNVKVSYCAPVNDTRIAEGSYTNTVLGPNLGRTQHMPAAHHTRIPNVHPQPLNPLPYTTNASIPHGPMYQATKQLPYFPHDGFMEIPQQCSAPPPPARPLRLPLRKKHAVEGLTTTKLLSGHSTPVNALVSKSDAGKVVFRCDFPGCHEKTFGRHHELKRHQRKHSNDSNRFWCSTVGCSRSVAEGGHPFYRKDKRNDHERIVHGVKHEGYAIRKRGAASPRKRKC